MTRLAETLAGPWTDADQRRMNAFLKERPMTTEPDPKTALIEAAKGLQPKHFKWMLDAARKHFEVRVETLEADIMRHEHFVWEANRGSYWHLRGRGDDGDRTELVQRLREELERARRFVGFLRSAELLVEKAIFDVDGETVASWATNLWPGL